MVTSVALWLLRRAADRWPAEIRDELRTEWTAEIRTIERDRSLSTLRQARLMLGFSVSLALSRPAGGQALGWKRVTGVVGVVSAWLLLLAWAQQGWQSFVGWSGASVSIGLGARLAQGALALLPILLAVAAGWWLGRRFPARRVRPLPLGLSLIAVVAGWVGLAFIVERLLRGVLVPAGLPYPPLMSYSFGNQPYGMVTSWVVWLIAFVLLASVVGRVARTRVVRRLLAAAGVVVLVAGVAVTAATFVQFEPATAPRSDAWMWFGQWFVPPDPDVTPHLQGGDSFQTARDVYFLVSSYPHVLLAMAAFGVATLMANNRQPDLANGLGIESSSSRV